MPASDPARRSSVPYAEIETLFLDVGNTLISMDYERLAAEFCAESVACDATSLARAEAAARPAVSARVHAGSSTEEADTFEFYLSQVLRQLGAQGQLGAHGMGAEEPSQDVTRRLLGRLREPGASHLLWNSVLPGVVQALADLRGMGLQLAVVSNSDGTVEQSLRDLGLHAAMDTVLDSAVVGFEKPDIRIFQQAVVECEADPKHTLHFGDIYHVDVLGARAAGLHAALIDPFDDWGAHLRNESHDCDRFRSLTALTERLRRARRSSS